MKKAILISIRSKWCELIASGKKTIEIRKTRPKLELPFKVYVYCTSEKQRLLEVMHDGDMNFGEVYHGKPIFIRIGGTVLGFLWHRQRKVIGEFTCDWIKDFGFTPYNHGEYAGIKNIHELSCVGFNEMYEYIGDSFGYGWHIKDFKLYDEPKEVSEYFYLPERYCEKGLCRGCPYDQLPSEAGDYDYDCEWKRPISRPPQSWMFVQEAE